MTVREIALKLLDEYELGGKFVNLSLSSHSADKLLAGERAFLTHLLYTAVERKLTYDYYVCSLSGRGIDKIDPHTLNILRLGFAQLSMESVPAHAAVNETVKLARSSGERSFVNGILRAAVRKAEEGLPLPERKKNAARYLSIAYSFPQPLCKELVCAFGESEAEAMLNTYNTARYTDITVNALKISREELAKKLREDGFDVSLSRYSGIGLRIIGSCDPKKLYGFSDGLFFVQDEASAVSAEVISAKAGERIIDVCACPGGKSLAASVMSEGKAEIISFDIHMSKLSLIESSAKRLQLSCITVGERDARFPDEKYLGTADKVICDCPCSGLGVLGKKPDLRYRSGEGDKELPRLQREILEASAGYLKVGGELVYSTCTLRDCENRCVIEGFLNDNPGFEAVDFTVGELSSEKGMLTLLPHIHGTDGFFVAKLKRKQ